MRGAKTCAIRGSNARAGGRTNPMAATTENQAVPPSGPRTVGGSAPQLHGILRRRRRIGSPLRPSWRCESCCADTRTTRDPPRPASKLTLIGYRRAHHGYDSMLPAEVRDLPCGVDWLPPVNVARMRGPLDPAQMRDLVPRSTPVNRLADASPGSIRRLKSGDGHVAGALPDGDSSLVPRLSAWEPYEGLHAFVHRSVHRASPASSIASPAASELSPRLFNDRSARWRTSFCI